METTFSKMNLNTTFNEIDFIESHIQILLHLKTVHLQNETLREAEAKHTAKIKSSTITLTRNFLPFIND